MNRVLTTLRLTRPMSVAFRAAAAPAIVPTAARRFAQLSTSSAQAASSTAKEAPRQEVYGAPYTNSIGFKPMAGNSAELSISAPQWPAVHISLTPEQTLGEVSEAIQRAIPAAAAQQPIVWYLNGARAANDRTILSAYGSAWELGLDGCRWSVAGGGRITPAGVSQPASRMATSMKVTAVAVAIIVSSFTFWKAVVPPDQQRVM